MNERKRLSSLTSPHVESYVAFSCDVQVILTTKLQCDC